MGGPFFSPSRAERVQEVIVGLERLALAFEKDVETQKGTGLLISRPWTGSCDRSGTTRGEKPVVCKKGDQCKFLHQNDVARMPKCHFSFKSGDCSNKECPFLHVKPAFKTQDCPGDDRGFCKHAGPLCKYRHVRRTKCTNYLKLAPARKDPGTNLHTCQAAPGVHTSSCLGTKRGPLPDKSACLLILRRGPVSRGLPTAWGSGAGAGRATGCGEQGLFSSCRARPSCCGGSSLAAELALRVTGTPLQLWSSPFVSRGLLFSCGARPSRRRGCSGCGARPSRRGGCSGCGARPSRRGGSSGCGARALGPGAQ
ncbi:putative cleavage and polyadenylation specificity factor subunit 4-like protein [Bubalus kerabau]|uniref:putative cleavage and polyadenylation specificity factor subunit 4-like protein n=1 Tax=Bubalus carabanensis TaxID=3119969 RepID=UPI00244E7660|nr:putative cleavage and polyadenylation specificity factor subunit 4-like protein [Bubalus carabanensis]